MGKLFDRAALFATEAHAGQTRKGKDKPYILHPMEAAAIVGRCLDSLEGTGRAPEGLLRERETLLAAAVLHDVVEDAGVTPRALWERFGARVMELVLAESEDKMADRPAEDTWKERKRKTIDDLAEKGTEAKLLVLGDKLSNLREIAEDHEALGEALWERFNRKDPGEHKWYYGEILRILEADPALGGLPAVREYRALWEEAFRDDREA